MKVIQAPKSLSLIFRLGVLALVVYLALTATPDEPVLILAATVVGLLAVLPTWLWCSQRVCGLPLFPLLALTYLPTFALPLLEPTNEVTKYSVEVRLLCAVAVALFLVVATLVWFPFARRAAQPVSYWAFRGANTDGIFLFFVLLGDTYYIVANAGWLPPWLPPGSYSILRTVCVGLAGLGATVLGYRWGTRQLAQGFRVTFSALFIVLMLAQASSLSIISAGLSFLMATAMFSLGRGRLPLTAMLVAVMFFSVLHAGKHPMRAKYWFTNKVLLPEDYPSYYAEWIEIGLNNMIPGTSETRKVTKTSSLADRSSLLQMLALVISKTTDEKPFLIGKTYEIVPEMLVPRFLLEEKALAHEGTTILSVHFGRQTREATKRTTIGFGHLAESYANFGWLGVVGLGLFTGGTVGWITRWSAGVPIDSFRGLVGLMFLGVCIQTEHTAGVTAGSVSQGLQLLFVLSLVLMEPRKNDPAP